MPASPAPAAPPRPRSNASRTRLAILIIGGWLITTIAQGVLNHFMASNMSASIALGSLLRLVWIAVVVLEIVHLVQDRRAPRAVGAEKAETRASRPAALSIVAIACPILVLIWVKVVFFSGPIQGHGESAQIGIAAAGFLCVVGILVGVASAVAALFLKEPRKFALTGLAANAAAVLILYILGVRGGIW